MAGGFVYNAIDQTEVATAEIYGKALADIMQKDPKVVAITADLAKSTKLGDVLKVCPERVINVGIAEQDMFGVAAGMARAGMIGGLSDGFEKCCRISSPTSSMPMAYRCFVCFIFACSIVIFLSCTRFTHLLRNRRSGICSSGNC